LKEYEGTVLFTTHDHEFMNSVANRIIEITPAGIIDKEMTYDEYILDPRIKEIRESMYQPA
jgi:ATPase subunit of ABC transporter with duplicated ATPase domains